jgi:hypothetical protein
MNESEVPKESESASQPEEIAAGNAPPIRTIAGIRDPLSKVAGAGVGALIVYVAFSLDLTAEIKFRIATFAPFIGGIVSALGPPFQNLLFALGRYSQARFFYWQLKRRARSAPDDQELQAKLRESRSIFADALSDGVRKWRRSEDKEKRSSRPKDRK